MPHLQQRVLVVGTTPDYINYIRTKVPDRALFITDPDVLDNTNPLLSHCDELVCPLRKYDYVMTNLADFLDQNQFSLSGIACFDCESLRTAAIIAKDWKLPFVSEQSVLYCRNKYLCKQKWSENRIPCPEAIEIYCLQDIIQFISRKGYPVILKPISGSGSELVFKIDNMSELISAYETILNGLMVRSNERMYSSNGTTIQTGIVCEEFIDGKEFSCDVFYDGEKIKILRIARKYFLDRYPACFTAAYEIPSKLPAEHGNELLECYLKKAADIAGFRRAVFMVDFIWSNGAPYFIEMSPRLGGDCIPAMVKYSCGTDMLKLELDFAEGLPVTLPAHNLWKRVIGIKFYAEHAGILKSIHIAKGKWQNNILESLWAKRAGASIKLPPEDYISCFLGHIVLSPDNYSPVYRQIDDIIQAVNAEVI